ncbi:MAG: hypothetical protein HYR66_08835 [Sphingobacteriales bacterium]|nr:hypothetical protein [Sphingobacteriales bacterium]MBI3720807.1 hypothetical protein [Sphingobacteriales bacterium]
MINAFKTLNVNFVALTNDLGLPHTLFIKDLDFTHIYQTYDANAPDTGKAITVPFKKNSNSSLNNYGFTLYTDGVSYIKPTIIHSVTNQALEYYDLTEILVTTISNYSSSNYTFSTISGDFANTTPLSHQTTTTQQAAGGCGQRVANCLADLYTNRGWLSVWTFVQTAFIPETAVAATATCIFHNCIF